MQRKRHVETRVMRAIVAFFALFACNTVCNMLESNYTLRIIKPTPGVMGGKHAKH